MQLTYFIDLGPISLSGSSLTILPQITQLRFLRTTARILSRSDTDIAKFVFCDTGEFGNGLPLSPSTQLITKRLSLSDGDEIIIGPFNGTGDLPLLRILAVIFQNQREPSFGFAFNFGSNCLYIDALSIFGSFAMVTNRSESSNTSVTPLSLIEIVVIATMSYDCRAFGREPRVARQPFLWRIKLSMLK